ncbi:hypothetical protein [Kroppenstedtia guangzhouensis]|uniref:hypothetical protein n=1 Tax=Kroppenstedtia guangzhouensis TaxID=1274356 RepID=UPI0016647E0F|nr:hypothetical protein [Kroppenstedtia guangzhouensis]
MSELTQPEMTDISLEEVARKIESYAKGLKSAQAGSFDFWLRGYLEEAADRIRYGREPMDEREKLFLRYIAGLGFFKKVDGERREVNLDILSRERLEADDYIILPHQGKYFGVRVTEPKIDMAAVFVAVVAGLFGGSMVLGLIGAVVQELWAKISALFS